MAWIKMREELRTDPAVVHIASRCGVTTRHAVGALMEVWAWAGRLSEDGVVPFGNAAVIDEVAGSSGFAQAMVEVGWLGLEPTQAVFPNWDRHNSDDAKARALAAERQRKRRAADEALSRSGVTSVTVERDASVTRGEERREEQEERRAHARGASPGVRSTGPKQWEGDFPTHLSEHGLREAWGSWLTYKAERSETVTQLQGDTAIQLFDQFGAKAAASAIRQAIAAGWKGFRLEDDVTVGGSAQTGPMRRVTGPFCAYCGVQGNPVKDKCSHCRRAWIDGQKYDAERKAGSASAS